GLGRTAVDTCHGKTVCVPHYVAAGKFVGAPWGRKMARHSITSSARARSVGGTVEGDGRNQPNRQDARISHRQLAPSRGARYFDPQSSILKFSRWSCAGT